MNICRINYAFFGCKCCGFIKCSSVLPVARSNRNLRKIGLLGVITFGLAIILLIRFFERIKQVVCYYFYNLCARFGSICKGNGYFSADGYSTAYRLITSVYAVEIKSCKERHIGRHNTISRSAVHYIGVNANRIVFFYYILAVYERKVAVGSAFSVNGNSRYNKVGTGIYNLNGFSNIRGRTSLVNGGKCYGVFTRR